MAQNSGQAISGAIDTAISEGFSDGGQYITPGAGGMRFNFAADPDGDEDDKRQIRSAVRLTRLPTPMPASGSDRPRARLLADR